MSNSAIQSRTSRRALIAAVHSAYRNATGDGSDRASVPVFLDFVADQADTLAQVASPQERDDWERFAGLLRQPATTDAAELLDGLGYEVSAWMLARIWRCVCSDTFGSADALSAHISNPPLGFASNRDRKHAEETRRG